MNVMYASLDIFPPDCIFVFFLFSVSSFGPQPSNQPSVRPTKQPSVQPSSFPTQQPSNQPTVKPSKWPGPTGQPSQQPSSQPSMQPSHAPTIYNANPKAGVPTGQPSMRPSQQPTVQVSVMNVMYASLDVVSPDCIIIVSHVLVFLSLFGLPSAVDSAQCPTSHDSVGTAYSTSFFTTKRATILTSNNPTIEVIYSPPLFSSS